MQSPNILSGIYVIEFERTAYFSFVQPENAVVPTVVKVDGNLSDSIPVLVNAYIPIEVRPSGKLIEERLEQLVKAKLSIKTTSSWNKTDFRLLQPLNVLFGIDVVAAGIIIDSMLLSKNIEGPENTALSGRLTVFKLLHALKA